MSVATKERGVILVVDDTPTNLEVLFNFLTDSGFKILVAENGESAIQKAEYASPDLLLLDIIMPGIDGFETCRRLKAKASTRDIPVLFMTALSETVDKVTGFQVGAVDYLTKPLQQEEVLARVQTHLSLRNLTKQLQEKNLQLEQEIKQRQQQEKELKRQYQRSQLFAEVTFKIRQSLNLEEVRQTAVTEVQKILQADRVLIYRLWPDGTGSGVAEAVLPGWPAVMGQKFPEEVFPEEYRQLYKQGRIRRLPNVENDEEKVSPCLVEFVQQFKVKAKLVVPIITQEELWGLLIAHQCASSRHWTDFETELLRQLADQIGIALTQAQLLEQETRYSQELARSNAELQQFASVASHDLQEPLRKIQAFGNRLQEKYGEVLSEQGRDYIKRMQNAARRMQTLIDDLLIFSRITTKAQPFIPVNLAKVTKDVLSDLEVLIQQTGGSVEVGELPTIDADPLQMRQLLQNLIGNALKFHQANEPPRVKIYSQIVGEREPQLTENLVSTNLYQITVEDSGIGFDQKYCDRIFQVFQRLHSHNAYEGTGMGLAICRKIVERHGGSITAKSMPGQGAKFIVTIPVTQRSIAN